MTLAVLSGQRLRTIWESIKLKPASLSPSQTCRTGTRCKIIYYRKSHSENIRFFDGSHGNHMNKHKESKQYGDIHKSDKIMLNQSTMITRRIESIQNRSKRSCPQVLFSTKSWLENSLSWDDSPKSSRLDKGPSQI